MSHSLLNFKESFFNYLNLGEKVAEFSERSSQRFSLPSVLIESTGKYNSALSLFTLRSLLFNIEVHYVGFCKYDTNPPILLNICSVLFSIQELL